MRIMPPGSVKNQDFSGREASTLSGHEISMGSGCVNQDIFMAGRFKSSGT
jgi:hypothetical protein